MSTTPAAMTAKPKRTPFHRAFHIANVMEIFERLSWYGFFAVSSIYMTSPTAQGGLGFNDQQRGILQGIIPFLLYIFPVVTGALGDRYGYRRMFLIAFTIMTPAYYLLGQVHGFWSFALIFLSVAVGAAIFKPLILGTIARTTDDSNRGLGFGIFYMMVNIGGFGGPLIAGTVRTTLGWDWVFILAAIWIAVNFIPAIFIYRDPPAESNENRTKRLKDVVIEMQQVIGNGRFALVVVPSVIALMLAGGAWVPWATFLQFMAVWIAINMIWNRSASDKPASPWYAQKTKIGNRPFILYILIVAGFWTIYQQLYYTLPLYIRDYVDTSNIVHFFHDFAPAFGAWLAHIDVAGLSTAIGSIHVDYGSTIPSGAVHAVYLKLVHYSVMIPEAEIVAGIQSLGSGEGTATALAQSWAQRYPQINPEYIMSLNFLSIILFQVLVSVTAEKYKAIHILMFGTLLVGISYALTGFSHMFEAGGIIVMVCVVGFSFGEMFASPKSQDYVAGIMPKAQAAMFMGYYFVSMAIGFLFGGLLSGWGYTFFIKEMNRPDLLWGLFGAIGLIVVFALGLFNKFVAPRLEAQRANHA